jgi:hypothetical protein
MEFEDRGFKVYRALQDEFRNYKNCDYVSFLAMKDIGIKYIDKNISAFDHYEIIDEKKWLLAKIKYEL